MTSWGWSYALLNDVQPQATAQVATPGLDMSAMDPATAQLALDGFVLVVGTDASVTFDGANATVTNLSAEVWEAGQNLYVYVAAQADAGGGIPEAPADGNVYARQGGAWVPVRPPIPDPTQTYGLTGTGVKGTAADLQWSAAVPAAGGSVNGDLEINGAWLQVRSTPNNAAIVYVNGGPPGMPALLIGRIADVDMWRIYLAAMGPPSDFHLVAMDDTGTVETEALNIERATGNLTLNAGVAVPNLPIADPHVAGVLWNNSGNVKVSLG
jgi:hypothetical protein